MAAAIDRTHTGDQFPKARHTAENLVPDGSVEYLVDMRTYSTVSSPVVIEQQQMQEFFCQRSVPVPAHSGR